MRKLLMLMAFVFASSLWAADSKKSALPSKATEAHKSDEARDFQRADELFKAGEEDKALVSLTDFLRRYPASQKADDVQYMIGAIAFHRRNFPEAIRELKKTLEYRNRAGADRIADAFLLVAESWYKLGDVEKAVIEWEALKRAFPSTPAAEQAQMRVLELRSETSKRGSESQ